MYIVIRVQYRVCAMSKMLEMSFSFSLNLVLSMLKISMIDQIHLKAVMICISEMSKMGKEHTHTFLLITFLIFNRFLKSFGKLRLRAFQPYHQILCILKHVEDVKDTSNTPKERSNAVYAIHVKNVKEIKENITH